MRPSVGKMSKSVIGGRASVGRVDTQYDTLDALRHVDTASLSIANRHCTVTCTQFIMCQVRTYVDTTFLAVFLEIEIFVALAEGR